MCVCFEFCAAPVSRPSSTAWSAAEGLSPYEGPVPCVDTENMAARRHLSATILWRRPQNGETPPPAADQRSPETLDQAGWRWRRWRRTHTHTHTGSPLTQPHLHRWWRSARCLSRRWGRSPVCCWRRWRGPWPSARTARRGGPAPRRAPAVPRRPAAVRAGVLLVGVGGGGGGGETTSWGPRCESRAGWDARTL